MSALPPPPLLRHASDAAKPSDRLATPEDVAHCYRTFLGREMAGPEEGAIHLGDGPEIWTLVERFVQAPENQLNEVFRASQYIQSRQDSRDIDLRLDDRQREALTAHIESVWRRYGREDAYFSVMTNPAYRSDRITRAGIDHFYETGQAELVRFENICCRNGVETNPAWSVYELGCGVARVGAAFAASFAGYLGVDISAEHLDLARERLDQQGAGEARLMLLSEFLQQDAGYDLFYSTIVLQHNPPPIIHQLLDESLARLRPGGYAYFQLPCYLEGYRFDVDSYLSGVGQSDTMEMHALPQKEVFALLARHGLTPLEVAPDASIGPIGISYAFLARKSDCPS